MTDRVRFPKCPHCRRRPLFREAPGPGLEVPGPGGPIKVPKYEALPCCSARYLKTVEGPMKRQRIRTAAEAARRRGDG